MLPSPSRLRPLDTPAPAFGRADLRVVPQERRVAVLLNANAKKVTTKVRDQFARLVPSEDLYFCESLEDGRRHTRSILAKRYDTLMVGGGDGTIATTLNLLVQEADKLSRPGHRHALPDLGILKLGTGNGLANMSGAGKPVSDAMRLVSGERPAARPLRVIEDVDSGWVFPFGSVGYDAQVLNDYVDLVDATRTGVGRSFAKSLAGYFYAIGTRTIPTELRKERAHIRIIATGRSSILDPETSEEIPLDIGTTLFEGSARAVAVGTSPFYGYGMKVLPYALRRTDRFHMRISNASISYLLSHLPSLWNGTINTPDFVDFLCEGIRIESSVALPLQLAGDARGHTKVVNMRLADRAFRLVEGTGKALA